MPADPALIQNWLTARSVARGLPAPVADHGGWRVETALPHEARRFVFAEAGEGLRALGEAIREPLVFLKLCGEDAALRALLPERWALQTASTMMTFDGAARGGVMAPAGYKLEVSRNRVVTSVRILAEDGALAASGFAAEADGAFVYDRIVTDPAHRRRGLGALTMAALGGARRSAESRQVLVATAEGRALYEALGWAVHSPYATAVIPKV